MSCRFSDKSFNLYFKGWNSNILIDHYKMTNIVTIINNNFPSSNFLSKNYRILQKTMASMLLRLHHKSYIGAF